MFCEHLFLFGWMVAWGDWFVFFQAANAKTWNSSHAAYNKISFSNRSLPFLNPALGNCPSIPLKDPAAASIHCIFQFPPRRSRWALLFFRSVLAHSSSTYLYWSHPGPLKPGDPTASILLKCLNHKILGPKLFFVTGLVIFITVIARLVCPDLLG